VANGRVPVANGGPPSMMLPSQSHSSLSKVRGGSPARTVPSRSSSSYSLQATQWARPLTTSFDEIDHHVDLANHFPRMDQQYLSFNHHRRAVSPVPPIHQLPGQSYRHDCSSPTSTSRLDYHAAMEQQQNNLTQQQHHTGQQRNHIDQRMSYPYQMNQQPNQGSQQQHIPRQSSPPSNVFQQQQHLYQQQMNHVNHQHLEQRISPPYHMGQHFNDVSQSQQHHVSQPSQHVSQTPQYVTKPPQHVSHQQHMGQRASPVNQQQQQQNFSEHRQCYYSDRQQQHQTALPSSTSQYNNNHPSTYPSNFSLSPPPQPVPEGYIKMHSVGAQLSQPTTPVDYVQMNSPPINDSPRTYSLNVPTTPPGVEQRPLDTVHKAPQVAPKPSRPPKKSALLSGGTGNVNFEQVKSSKPPVIPAKKNSPHRRKGLATYDQTDNSINNISQQLGSTSISSEPSTVPSDLPPFNAQSKDVSPKIAPVSMPTSAPKSVSYPCNLADIPQLVLIIFSYHLAGFQRWIHQGDSFIILTVTWATLHGTLMR